MVRLDIRMILIYLGCLIGIIVIGKIFIVPIKFIVKLLINSIIGGILLYLINLIGTIWSFHIGINLITALTVGLLGIPGAVLLVVIQLLLI